MERTKENIREAVHTISNILSTIQTMELKMSKKMEFIDFHNILFPISQVFKVHDKKDTVNSYQIGFSINSNKDGDSTHVLYKMSDVNGLEFSTSKSCSAAELKIICDKGYMSLANIHRHYFNSFRIHEILALNMDIIKII
jgi:hypothetical protein